MDSREAEEHLSELESRLERLRALYEQYFMGIERMEPQIPRKEVERRIWELRREQIRNTGLRFKFQMLVQRYNTFQQYWGRVSREIENGTYRRDVMRAAARFGEKDALTILGRRRQEKYMRLAEAQRAQRERNSTAPGANGEGDIDEIDVELESEPPPPVPPPEPTRPGLGAPAPPPDPEAARRRVAALAAQMKTTGQRAPLPASAGAADASGPLDLDLDLESRRPPARKSSSGRMRALKIPAAPSVPSDLGDGGRRSPAPTPARGRRRSSATMKAVRAAPPPPPQTRADVPGAPTPPPQKPAVPAPPPTRPGPPAPPPERAAAPANRPAAPPAPAPDAPPAQRAPAPAPPPQRPAGEPPAARQPAARPGELEEQRLRQIYAKYLESKRRANESTAGLTFERLAESLRSQAAKLRESHPTRRVDYEVVLKDGKTVLKPILR